jgi:hypothetical protein
LLITRDQNTVHAYGINSRYAFHLRQYDDTEEWIIEKLVFHAEDPSHDVVRAAREARVCITTGFTVFPRSLLRYMEQPTFEVTLARTLLRGSDELVEIAFVYQPKDKFDVRIRKGVLLLDPTRYWMIREFHTEMDWPSDEIGTVSGSFEYDSRMHPIPVVKKAQTKSRSKPVGPKAKEYKITGPSELHIISEYDARAFPEATEKDFMLSAFGLPEPPEPGGAGRGIQWLWIPVAGALLVIIALLLRRRTSRPAM